MAVSHMDVDLAIEPGPEASATDEPKPPDSQATTPSEHSHVAGPLEPVGLEKKEHRIAKFFSGFTQARKTKALSDAQSRPREAAKPDSVSSPVLAPLETEAPTPRGVSELRRSIQRSWNALFHKGLEAGAADLSAAEGTHIKSQADVEAHQRVPEAALLGTLDSLPVHYAEASFLSKYHFCSSRVIGKGASSVVRLAQGTRDNTLYAVKEFRKKRKEESQRDYVKKLTAEYCISSLCHHPNIVETFDILRDGSHWYEVMEYCPGGDLFTVIRDGYLDFDDVDICFKELLLGVQYLHQMGIAHRDLKPENLLIDSLGHLKITDFGVSEVFHVVWEKAPHLSRGICGSAPYIAPEVLTGREYDAAKMDIWACGIIYYAMKFHGIPWALASPNDAHYRHYLKHRGIGEEPLVRLPRGPQSLLRKILEPDPAKRLSIDEILQDSWVQSINVNTKGHFQQLLSSKRMRKVAKA